MRHGSLDAFLAGQRDALARGPVLLLLVEDEVEVESTLRHHLDAGFRRILAFAHPSLAVPDMEGVDRIDADMSADGALTQVVNACIRAAVPGTWMGYLYNAEYLFYPFSETRSVGEMCAFATEERRESVLTYVVDLYAGDLEAHPSGVSLQDAWLDRSGYYALTRKEPPDWQPLERQLDFFGGLRWRHEEHVPYARRRIDRVGLFRAGPGRNLRPDHTFDVPEMNTYACAWHNSVTAAICSFRVAKALRRNPGSRQDIQTFRWHNSARFTWGSQQLLALGLMEPGQWF